MHKQIHHVIATDEVRYVPDPSDAVDHAIHDRRLRRGFRAEHHRVLAPSGVSKIAHEGETYKIAPDGTFTVPEHVAEHMLRMPGWNEGPSPFGSGGA